MKRAFFRLLLSFLPFLAASHIDAAEQIVLGQSAALTGPASMLGTEMARGMNAYFNEVNEHGGVNGRSIKLITLDDGYEPDRTLKNTQALINDDKVVALVGYVGTPTSMAALPAAKAAGLPFIGAYTGADGLRDGKYDNIYNIRASYNDEALRIAKEIDGMGLRKMGIVYQNDAFGQAGLRAMQAALTKHPNLKVAWTESVERNSTKVDAAVAKIMSEHVDSVFVVSAYATTGELLRRARKMGYVGVFTTLSFVGEEPLAQVAGTAAQGVLVPAVMPSPHSEPVSLSAEYRRAMAKGVTNPHFSYASMEGYVAAKVIVEALRSIKGNVTPPAIDAAMRNLHLELGGFAVDFSKSHNASQWVESTMIGAGGKITR
ncbi:MAG: ABC transporter substrate-binding protein [Burkholderiaceae bacterium]|nr:ABC transporter substrate-binding protein [Burkholderiaceae bacterium]